MTEVMGLRVGIAQEAVFVPPPIHEVGRLMADLERYINDLPESSEPLIKAALSHVQLETIHPFIDGNGRIGRLLITLLLCADGLLVDPTLYLSLYFKRNRKQYYDRLNSVRVNGDWEGWLEFFLDGVVEIASEAIGTVQQTTSLIRRDRERVISASRAASLTPLVFESAAHHVVVTARELQEEFGSSLTSINNSIKRLEEVGILREMTGKKRDRVYAYSDFLEILARDTEPIAAAQPE